MTNDEHRRWYIDGAGRTGLAIDPLPFLRSGGPTAPAGYLMQRSVLTDGPQRLLELLLAT